MRLFAVTLAILMWMSLTANTSVFAQDADSAKSKLEAIKNSAPPPLSTAPVVQDENDYGAFRIQQEITHRTLMVVVIAAAIASLVIVLWFLKLSGTHDPTTIVNASGLVLVIYGTIL